MNERHYCPECDQRLGDNTWWCKPCQSRHFEENFDNWTTGDEEIDDFIKLTQKQANEVTEYLEFIPFKDFLNFLQYDKVEVGTIYSANWQTGPLEAWDVDEKRFVAKRPLIKVALCQLGSTPSNFLKELKLHYYARTQNGLMVRLFGVTRSNKNLMMVSETCEWDVRHYVSHHWISLEWQKKIAILYSIACGLEEFHDRNNPRKELQNTTIKIVKSHIEISLEEFGFPDSHQLVPVIGYYQFDILPFFAPEILDEGNRYYPQSDIYTFGMLMWEFAANRPPFYKQPRDFEFVKNIRQGLLHPKPNSHTPPCYCKLMERCWSEYEQRPTFSELVEILRDWHLYSKEKAVFRIAENLRKKMFKNKGLDTNPDKMLPVLKSHPQAIYVTRLIKFPVMNPSRQSLSDVNDPVNQSTENSASVLVSDNSFFTDRSIIQLRAQYPEPVPLEDHVQKQLSLRIVKKEE